MRTWESRQLLVRSVVVLVGAVVLGAGLAYALTDRQPDDGGGPLPDSSQVLEEAAEREKPAAGEPEPTATPARKSRRSERRGERTRRTAQARLARTPVGTSQKAASTPEAGGRAAPRSTAPERTATPAPRRSGRRPASELEPVATPRRTPQPESTSAPAPAPTVAPAPTAAPTPVATATPHPGRGQGNGNGSGNGHGPGGDGASGDVGDG